MANDASPRTLNGWKEIAAHLGKSVRSVQRWERDLGLPVHRINTPDNGQIIYADSAEIDRWLRRLDDGALTTPASEAAAPAAQAPAPVKAAPRFWFGAAILVIVAGALFAGTRLGRRADLVPVSFEFVGRELLATAANGKVVWRHEFDDLAGPPNEFEPPGSRAVADGAGGFIVPVRFGPRGVHQPARTDRVVAFDRNGWVRWEVEPSVTMRLGDREFAGPWHARAIVVGTGDQLGRTWIAYKHNTWLPSFVLEVQANGRSAMRYAQAGWIASVALWRDGQDRRLVVGGVSNEHQMASLAFIDLNAPPSQGPPSSGPRLTCTGCPSGLPLQFVLFPSSEVGPKMGEPYALADALSPLPPSLKVHLNDSRVAFIDGARRVASLDFSDEYWAWHRLAEQEGVITHAAVACPERGAPKTIRSWTPESQWIDYTVNPTVK